MDSLAKILDKILMQYDPDRHHVRVGIWDASVVPYTVYALLTDGDGYPVAGESSYGSETVEEALGCVLKELQKARNEQDI